MRKFSIALSVFAFLLIFSAAGYGDDSLSITIISPGNNSVITSLFDIVATAAFPPASTGTIRCCLANLYGQCVRYENYYTCTTQTCTYSAATFFGLLDPNIGSYQVFCSAWVSIPAVSDTNAITVTKTPPVPNPPSDKGRPSNAQPGNTQIKDCGAPVWSVNKINMNLYVSDTPLWYKPAIGPSVELQMSYNSQATVDAAAPFGNKWTLTYGSYLSIGGDGKVTVNMPDGRQDVYTPNGSSYTQPFGVFNTLTKIAGNHYQLAFLDGTVYDYDIPPGTGLTRPSLTKISDAYGQSLTLSYQAGKLTTITDALGKITTLNYYASGLMQNVTDPFGRFTSFEYDASRNLTKTTDMGGYVTTYQYGSGGNSYLASITDPKGTWGFTIEPSDSATNPAPYPDPNAAAPKMGKILSHNHNGPIRTQRGVLLRRTQYTVYQSQRLCRVCRRNQEQPDPGLQVLVYSRLDAAKRNNHKDDHCRRRKRQFHV